MNLNLFKVKKWIKMVIGKSSYHVKQNEGLCYSVDGLEGYYNNLTEKITRFGMPGEEIPITADDDGYKRHFSIAIFQYGLAANDLYLMTQDESMLRRMQNCADWALENQLENGAWKTFEPQNPAQPFSSMAQGEGISLLTRMYQISNNPKYLNAARKAFQFMLQPRKTGGVAEWEGNELYLYEFTYMPIVLNGWIFSAWGILDFYKATGDKMAYDAWILTSQSIGRNLPNFDCGFWSKYNKAERLTSPFYHRLHIAQLQVMYKLTGNDVFKKYANRWQRQLNNPLYKSVAFIKKVYQKLIE